MEQILSNVEKIIDKNSTSYHLSLDLQEYLVGSQTKVLSLHDIKSHSFHFLKVKLYLLEEISH